MKRINQKQSDHKQLFIEKQYLLLLNSYTQMQNHAKNIALFSSIIMSIASSYFIKDATLLFPIIILSIIHSYKVITYDFSPYYIISDDEYNKLDSNLNDLTLEIGDYYDRVEKYLKIYLILCCCYISFILLMKLLIS